MNPHDKENPADSDDHEVPGLDPSDKDVNGAEAESTKCDDPSVSSPDVALGPKPAPEVSSEMEEPAAPATEELPEKVEAIDATAAPSGDEPDGSLAASESSRVTVAERREEALARTFTGDRPRDAELQAVASEYTDALTAGGLADTDISAEAGVVLEEVRARHRASLEREEQCMAESTSESKRIYEDTCKVYDALDTLVDQVATELAKLDTESEAFLSAPEPLRDTLGNYRKGIEIIHRMLARVRDKKPVSPEVPPSDFVNEVSAAPTPSTPDEFGAFFTKLVRAYHDGRDTNYHVCQDMTKFAETQFRELSKTVLALLAAIDGVDSGLANEAGVRDTISEFQESHGELLSIWFGAYDRLFAHMTEFLEAAAIESHDAEPGTPFDPDTMEPQGTIENPDLPEESVAAVMRRGYSLRGVLIRPMLVEVVRNT